MRTGLFIGIIIGVLLSAAGSGAFHDGGGLGSNGYWEQMQRDQDRFESGMERMEQQQFRDEQRHQRRPC